MKKAIPLKKQVEKYIEKTKLYRIDTNVGRCYTPDPMDEDSWKPSVTTLENIISKGIIFERWIANFGGYDKVSEYVGKKASDGTLVHEHLEDLINYNKIILDEGTPNHIKKFIQSFLAWWNETDVVPVATEVQLYHDDIPFSGTCDLLCYIDGQLSLVDFKTGNEYPTNHQIQLSCYKELHDQIFPKNTIKNIYCLHVKSTWRKKPTFKLRKYDYDPTISGALNYLWCFNLRANKTQIASKYERELPNEYILKEKNDGQ